MTIPDTAAGSFVPAPTTLVLGSGLALSCLERGDPAFVRDFQHSTLARPVPPAFFEIVVAESLTMPAQAWRSVLHGLLHEDVTPELHRIAAPTLVLWGERDVFTARPDQEALAAAIPAARLVVWPGAGHALHWEDPGRAAAGITAFVAAAGLA